VLRDFMRDDTRRAIRSIGRMTEDDGLATRGLPNITGRMADATELLERDAQLSELSALLESASSGEGRIALV
jgi:hypothetical protein